MTLLSAGLPVLPPNPRTSEAQTLLSTSAVSMTLSTVMSAPSNAKLPALSGGLLPSSAPASSAVFDQIASLVDQANAALGASTWDDAASAFSPNVPSRTARTEIAARLLGIRTAMAAGQTSDVAARIAALGRAIQLANEAISFGAKGDLLAVLQQIRNVAAHAVPNAGTAPSVWDGKAGTWEPSIGTGVPPSREDPATARTNTGAPVIDPGALARGTTAITSGGNTTVPVDTAPMAPAPMNQNAMTAAPSGTPGWVWLAAGLVALGVVGAVAYSAR